VGRALCRLRELEPCAPVERQTTAARLALPVPFILLAFFLLSKKLILIDFYFI
jgi:hypothetical protein